MVTGRREARIVRRFIRRIGAANRRRRAECRSGCDEGSVEGEHPLLKSAAAACTVRGEEGPENDPVDHFHRRTGRQAQGIEIASAISTLRRFRPGGPQARQETP